jgi:hypothetical protein
MVTALTLSLEVPVSPLSRLNPSTPYNDRFVNHFQAKRNRSWDYLEQWLKGLNNHSKGNDTADTYEADITFLPWIAHNCMFASREEPIPEAWLGSLDNPDMVVAAILFVLF